MSPRTRKYVVRCFIAVLAACAVLIGFAYADQKNAEWAGWIIVNASFVIIAIFWMIYAVRKND